MYMYIYTSIPKWRYDVCQVRGRIRIYIYTYYPDVSFPSGEVSSFLTSSYALSIQLGLMDRDNPCAIYIYILNDPPH